MLQPNYSIFRSGLDLAVVWFPPRIPIWMAAVGLLAAAAGLGAALFRRRLATAWQRSRLPEETRRRILLWGGLAAAAAGLVLAGISGHREPLLRWALDAEKIHVKSLSGQATILWKDVSAARLDAGRDAKADASLVLTDAAGKEMWLILKWLVPAHRSQLLHEIGRRAPAAMKPVLEDRAYFDSLAA